MNSEEKNTLKRPHKERFNTFIDVGEYANASSSIKLMVRRIERDFGEYFDEEKFGICFPLEVVYRRVDNEDLYFIVSCIVSQEGRKIISVNIFSALTSPDADPIKTKEYLEFAIHRYNRFVPNETIFEMVDMVRNREHQELIKQKIDADIENRDK